VVCAAVTHIDLTPKAAQMRASNFGSMWYLRWMGEPHFNRSARVAVAEELKSPGSLALLFMTTVLGLVTAFVLPEWKLPAAWPAIIAVVGVAAVWICVGALRTALARGYEAHLAGKVSLPLVVQALLTPGDEGTIILLLEPNSLFSVSTLVSIFYQNDEEFEILVAHGEVINVQGNGKIQVEIGGWEQAYTDIRDMVAQQNYKELKKLIIKPSVVRRRSVNPDPYITYGDAISHLTERTGD